MTTAIAFYAVYLMGAVILAALIWFAIHMLDEFAERKRDREAATRDAYKQGKLRVLRGNDRIPKETR